MGKVIEFPEDKKNHNRVWNLGYSDGYHLRPSQASHDSVYARGYEIGKDDREQDNEAIQSGQLDPMTEEERLAIYGDESDQP